MKFKKIRFSQIFLKILFFVVLPESIFANVVGSDFQNFNPTYSGLDFITVHSSETLEKCFLNTGLYYNHAYNSLPFFESVDFDVNEFRNRNEYSDVVGGFDFNVGYGLARDWDIGLNIQSFVYQKIETDALLSGSFEETGLSEVRLNSKYRLGGDDLGGLALVGSINVNTIENNIFLGEGAGPTLNLELVYDKTYRQINWAANVGYRLRNEGEVLQAGVIPFDDSFIYSGAFSYLFKESDLKIVGELIGSYPVNEVQGLTKKARSNLEALMGVKYQSNQALSMIGGLSTEVLSGTSTPDWRFFLGLNWAIQCCETEPVAKKVDTKVDEEIVAWADSLENNAPPPIKQEAPLDEFLDPIEFSQEVPNERFVARNINFRFGSSHKVYPNSFVVLEKVSNYLRNKKFRKLVVVGHTDSIGSDAYNLELSRKRSRSIVVTLINKYGLDREKLRYRYFGERRPIADNGNLQGRKKNRRVEFLIYY